MQDVICEVFQVWRTGAEVLSVAPIEPRRRTDSDNTRTHLPAPLSLMMMDQAKLACAAASQYGATPITDARAIRATREPESESAREEERIDGGS
ncbi:hypothetical protein DPEC_G00306440 [Dallia pectoralis]|uniref:Uncharacterized protein n=1 Tax=Dallia pectoralis TaxID=75939 RepID=A0ACC2FE33_DALPE|nr:hypothetical protein DPEC_G00306440 [Dallia pectoralis]